MCRLVVPAQTIEERLAQGERAADFEDLVLQEIDARREVRRVRTARSAPELRTAIAESAARVARDARPNGLRQRSFTRRAISLPVVLATGRLNEVINQIGTHASAGMVPNGSPPDSTTPSITDRSTGT